MKKIFIRISMYSFYGILLQISLCNLLLASTPSSAQKPFSTKEIYLTLELSNDDLQSVFHKIEEHTEFNFVYNNSVIDKNVKLKSNYQNTSLYDILIDISRRTGLAFKRVNTNINVKKLSKGQKATVTEEVAITITGMVGAEADGTGIPGVNVVVKGSNTGTVTDIEGRYSISAPNEDDILVFSSIGFATQEVSINGRSEINVILAEDVQSLEEVVVVGYGSVKRSDLTGSVASIEAEKITQVPVSSVDRALQGQVAGVQVNQKSGQPGQDVVIRIRGGNSITGGNDPLYVIDGLPVDGLGSEINPEDIESMEILKDASATAIYGSRGANGVVLITTKRGKQGRADINYHGFVSVQSLRKKLDLLDKEEYVAMLNEVAANDGLPPVYTSSEVAALPDNDWQDMVYRDAPMQSHNISISGGNENSQVYSSINYLNQEGIIRNTGFERFSFRINGDQRINDRMKVGMNVSYSRGKTLNSNQASADGPGAVPFGAIVMAPITPVRDNDGSYTLFSGTPWGGTNPIGVAEMRTDQSLTTRLISNLNYQYQITDDLSLNINLGMDASNSTNDFHQKIGLVAGGPTDGVASKRMSKLNTLVNENFLSYNKNFNIHSLNAVAGITYQETRSDFLSGSSSGFVTDIFGNNLIQAGTDPTPPQTGLTEFALLSYIGRLNYTLMDKYLFTFTSRYDGSSKFGANNKFAFFPSGAVGWRISDELFMEEMNAISELKLRASYGLTGNQAISPYQTLARMTTNVPVFGDGQDVGFVLSSFSNQELKWETTRQLDIGLDLGIFQNRVLLTADYYKKNTTDLLYNSTLPPSSGFQSSTRNVGEIENKGFEFQLNTRNLVGELKWSSNLNMTFNRSTVTDLGTDGLGNPIERIDAPIAGGNWFPLFLNEAPFQLYGFVVEGIYQTDNEAIENGEAGKSAGDYRFKDINDDGVINGDDQTLLTNLQPNFTFGFNNELSYKNFELSFLIVGSQGNDIVNEFNKYYTALSGTWNVRRDVWANRWTGPESGGSYAKASSTADDNLTFVPPNSVWVEDGSYVRLRDITFAYNLPSSLLETIGINRLRVYLSGQNLITITDYPHYDPEASWASSAVNGWDRGVYPSTKSFTAGVNITF